MALTLPVPASPHLARSLQPMRQRWQRRNDPPPATSSDTAEGGKKRLASIAVIGGGVAGLACARRLGALGLKATVFDTGKRGPGGRASSRTWRGQLCDHASQFVTATDKDFAEMLASSGAVRPFGKDGRFGTLSKANFEPLQDGVERWIGLEGVGGIVRMLAEGLDIQQARNLSRTNQ
ncbi:unnamed protein product [Symbiodinium sp. CCMP2456]|nr:unnamed protein product [Symbiodinium sp. CCMP2456]